MKANERFSTPLNALVEGIIPAPSFDTPRDLLEWLENEHKWLEGITVRVGQAVPAEPQLSPLANSVAKNVFGVIQQINQSLAVDGGEGAYAAALANYLEQFRARKIIFSLSTLGQFLTDISRSDPMHALRVIVCYCGLQFPNTATTSTHLWLRAGIDAAQYAQLGMARYRLDNSVNDFANKWKVQFQEIADTQSALVSQQKETNLEWISTSENLKATLALYKSTFDSELKKSHAELEAVRDAYRLQLTIEGPSTFWRKKQVGHRWVSGGCAFAFVLVGALAAYSVSKVWYATVAPYLQHLSVNQAVLPWYSLFLPTFGAAFLSVWVLRIISRQLIHNLAAASDAGERVAMVRTFLGLMLKPDHVKENDRSLILAALFRPSASSAEDGVPPTVLELIMQRLKV